MFFQIKKRQSGFASLLIQSGQRKQTARQFRQTTPAFSRASAQ
jgi:hypothetical protein